MVLCAKAGLIFTSKGLLFVFAVRVRVGILLTNPTRVVAQCWRVVTPLPIIAAKALSGSVMASRNDRPYRVITNLTL
jgi:hypothetical protein